VPRGAGLSYTGGMACDRPALALDLTRLDGIEVFAEDRYAVVGAGTSWARLAEALGPHGLEAAQASPISGEHATVGGLVAQGLPSGLGGVLGLTAVLGDGSVVTTGLAGRVPGARFWRGEGPDLTGLLMADCGSLAVKTEVVVRLKAREPTAFASFTFDTADALLAAMIPVVRDGLGRAFALDESKSDDARAADLGDAVRTAWALVRQARSPSELAATLAGLGRFAAKPPGGWSLHLTFEAPTAEGAAAQRARAGRRCREAGGREVPAIFPKALNAKPYAVRGLVGPQGERWVPLHGVFAPSRARAAMAALEAHVAGQAEALRTHGVRPAWLLSSSGAYVLIEPMLYWRDRLDPIHLRYLSDRNRARFGAFEAREAARAYVAGLRGDLRAIMSEHAAAHGQLGRFYPYAERLQPGTRALVERLKAAADPDAVLNPGALGLGRSRGR
jgi:FAD/FMN-containing dehydrogenase